MGSAFLLKIQINTVLFKGKIIFCHGYKIVYTYYTKIRLTRRIFVLYNIRELSGKPLIL